MEPTPANQYHDVLLIHSMRYKQAIDVLKEEQAYVFPQRRAQISFLGEFITDNIRYRH